MEKNDKTLIALGISLGRVVFALFCPWNILRILWVTKSTSYFVSIGALEAILIIILALLFLKVWNEDSKRYHYKENDKKHVYLLSIAAIAVQIVSLILVTIKLRSEA